MGQKSSKSWKDPVQGSAGSKPAEVKGGGGRASAEEPVRTPKVEQKNPLTSTAATLSRSTVRAVYEHPEENKLASEMLRRAEKPSKSSFLDSVRSCQSRPMIAGTDDPNASSSSSVNPLRVERSARTVPSENGSTASHANVSQNRSESTLKPVMPPHDEQRDMVSLPSLQNKTLPSGENSPVASTRQVFK